MHYYYADADSQPVGPYTMEQLQQLYQQGTLYENSWVIVEGAAEWKSYASLFPPVIDSGRNEGHIKRCISCGVENQEQARFCAECGTKIEIAALTERSRTQSTRHVPPAKQQSTSALFAATIGCALPRLWWLSLLFRRCTGYRRAYCADCLPGIFFVK